MQCNMLAFLRHIRLSLGPKNIKVLMTCTKYKGFE